MDSKEALGELRSVGETIDGVLQNLSGGYGDYDENIKYQDTPEERFYGNKIYKILERLDKVKDEINYLLKPVRATGILEKNSNGKYQMVSKNGDIEKVYHCGSSIEALVPDGDVHTWTLSRVEHNGQDYYIYGDRTVPMEGLEVRER